MLIWKKIVERGQGSETNHRICIHTAGLNPPVQGDTWDMVANLNRQEGISSMPAMERPSIATIGCLRALRTILIDDGLLATHQQTRGKKFVAKVPPTVKVKLLEDIKGYGARGSAISL